MSRRTQRRADTGEAPSHDSTHNQAEQLTLSYCYECISYTWRSSDSTGVFILPLLPEMIFQVLALPCSVPPATHQELCTRADTRTLVQQRLPSYFL